MMLLRQLKCGSEKVIELPNVLAKPWRSLFFAKSFGFSIGLVWLQLHFL